MKKKDDVTILNNNSNGIVVIGPSGSGKTHNYLIPKIEEKIKEGYSILVAEISDELFKNTADYADKEGYKIKQINFTNPKESDSWNPLQPITDAPLEEKEYLTSIMCETLLRNSFEESDDIYFDAAERNLLEAVILYVASEDFKRAKSFESVYSLLQTIAIQEGRNDEFDELCRIKPSHPSSARWLIFKSSGRLKINFITGLLYRLNYLQMSFSKDILSEDSNIDLNKFKKEKTIIYLRIPYAFGDAKPFTSLFIEQACRSEGENKSILVFDDAVYAGRIEERFLSRMETVMSFQSAQQMQKAYNDAAAFNLVSNE